MFGDVNMNHQRQLTGTSSNPGQATGSGSHKDPGLLLPAHGQHGHAQNLNLGFPGYNLAKASGYNNSHLATSSSALNVSLKTIDSYRWDMTLLLFLTTFRSLIIYGL